MAFSSEQLSLGLIISCAIFALTPVLLTTGSESIKSANSLTSQDHEYFVADSPLMIYSICIVVIPIADLFLDFVSNFFNDVSVQRCAHLSLTERLLFISGIALQSSKYFMRDITNSSTLNLVNNCIDNTNGLLLIGPIVLFLGRCASNFTATKSLYVILLFVGGILCRTLYYFSRASPAVQQGFSSTGAFIFISACVLYGSLVSQCIATNLGNNFLTMASRQKFAYRISEVFKAKFRDTDENSETKDVNECDCYASCLASLHMILSWIILVAKVSSNLSHRTEYVLLLAEVSVLIIESRIRKFEIARELAALLQSKKSYVRYISHELRTPLNTASLGLKLLSSDMKTSTDTRDKKRYDTIRDVSLSCKAAVSILNDLLCHDSLESGRLELHNETVAVLPFLLECISPFSAECQERGVTLTFSESPPPTSTSTSTSNSVLIPISTSITASTSTPFSTSSLHTHPIDECTNNTIDDEFMNSEKKNQIEMENMEKIMMNNSSAKGADSDRANSDTNANDDNKLSSLLPSDKIHFDRFKMDQVVRNLISNALKFTPKGGTISVRAYYKYDQCTENRNQRDADAYAVKGSCCMSMSKNQITRKGEEKEEAEEGEGLIHVTGEGVVNDIRSNVPLLNPIQCVKNVMNNNKNNMEMENSTSKNNQTSWFAYIITSLSSYLLCQPCTSDVRAGNDPVSDYTCGRLIVEVSDTGAGISIENQKRLFVEIIQFSPEKLQEGGGSGLGLWITSRILNLHKGTIKVHSEGERKGALFTFELPMTRNNNVSTVLPGRVSRYPSADQLFTSITETLGLNSGMDDCFVSHRSAEEYDIDNNNCGAPLDCFETQHERQQEIECAIDCLNVQSPLDKYLEVSDITTVRMCSLSDVIASTPLHLDILTDGTKTLDSMILDGPRPLDSMTLDGPRPLDSITLDGLQTLNSVQCDGPPSIDSLTSGESLFSPISKRKYNILVVDDSRLNRKMLSKCLQLDGYTCFEAEDGVQAVAQTTAFLQSAYAYACTSTSTRTSTELSGETTLSGSGSSSASASDSKKESKSNTFCDIILMDFHMPNMDGPTATQKIRELGFSGFIFGVTGIDSTADISHFMQSGADAVLLKPLDLEKFNSILTQLNS